MRDRLVAAVAPYVIVVWISAGLALASDHGQAFAAGIFLGTSLVVAAEVFRCR